ncbi:hypothetical protein D3C86_2155350 [compost metagenome]
MAAEEIGTTFSLRADHQADVQSVYGVRLTPSSPTLLPRGEKGEQEGRPDKGGLFYALVSERLT